MGMFWDSDIVEEGIKAKGKIEQEGTGIGLCGIELSSVGLSEMQDTLGSWENIFGLVLWRCFRFVAKVLRRKKTQEVTPDLIHNLLQNERGDLKAGDHRPLKWPRYKRKRWRHVSSLSLILCLGQFFKHTYEALWKNPSMMQSGVKVPPRSFCDSTSWGVSFLLYHSQ